MLEQMKSIQKELVEWRREFHMYPELGFEETRTSGRVAEILTSLGWHVQRGVGVTGVVAELSKAGGGPTVALRADMDALPIEEANEVSYKSRHDGVMHACGHDSHTAMLLGVARALAAEDFPGTIRLLFQPSEERADAEGFGGAARMIQAGAMQGVDMVFAQHVDPATPVGVVRISSGPSSGGVDTFTGRIIGRGGHGARPHETVDPFYLSAFVIVAINGIFSRRIDPFDPNVVSLGSVHGGQVANVIPDAVDMVGTIRFTEKRVQQKLHAEIRRAFDVVKPLGGDYKLSFEIGLPPMFNHPDAVKIIHSSAEAMLGKSCILPMEKELGAEDFSLLAEQCPGAMFVLGTKIEGSQRYGHNPMFDIDETALPIGAGLLAATALEYLRQANQAAD